MIRIHRIAYSTNVERVALAAGHKGVEVEWVDHDPADRAALAELSGQELVPVAELDGKVIVDSMRIVEHLEALAPEPALYPAETASRARLDVFVEWFNLVWKRPPNYLDSELKKSGPDPAVVEALMVRAREWTSLFEAMLTDGPYLGGQVLGAADVCAFPFLKYAVAETPADDVETFHPVLERCLKPAEAYPLLCDWVRRVDALPRA
jgi:glutathione S-transferase